jgi:hypothetical protein
MVLEFGHAAAVAEPEWRCVIANDERGNLAPFRGK